MMGLPVLPAFSLCTCCRHYPGAAPGCLSLFTSPDVSAFPDSAAGSACALSFSRFARRSLTLRPAHSPSHLVTLYIEGFSHFVTSMTASIASGWNKSCRVGLTPTGKRRLSTAHAECRQFARSMHHRLLVATPQWVLRLSDGGLPVYRRVWAGFLILWLFLYWLFHYPFS